MHQLLQLDKHLFHLINNHWNFDVLDSLLPFIRNQYLWFPLYLFLIAYGLMNFKHNGWKWVLCAIATVVLTNFISSDLIKNAVGRIRPCNDPDMLSQLRFLVGYRPRGYSFTSSHATNHFGLAAFFYYTLKPVWGKWGLLFFVWAALIGYAQIYVGVHYPLDVLAGSTIGFIFGYLSAKLFNRNYSLVQ